MGQVYSYIQCLHEARSSGMEPWTLIHRYTIDLVCNRHLTRVLGLVPIGKALYSMTPYLNICQFGWIHVEP